MLKRKCAFVITLLVFAFLCSCGDNDSDAVSPEEDSNVKLLSKIIDEGRVTTYNYKNKLLQSIVAETDTSAPVIFNYSYNEQNRITEINHENDKGLLKRTFHYNDKKQIDKVDYLYDDENRTFSECFYYNNNSGVDSVLVYTSRADTAFFRIYYKYNADENIVSSIVYMGGELFQTGEYQYDNKVNPYYALRECLLTDRAYSKNNQIKMSSSFFFGGEEVPFETEYFYTYDDDGYPVTVTFANTSGIVKRTFEYVE